MRRHRILHIVTTALLFITPITTRAQQEPPAPPDWTGSIAVAAVAREVRGSEDSFRSQTNLRSGLTLEELSLRRGANDADGTQFSITASGFGTAEPSSRARAEIRFRSPLTLTVSYNRRDSFLSLADPELGARRDDWSIARWNARLAWDGWRMGRLSLDLRRVARDGSVVRPFFGLNEQYPLRLALDQSTSEASLRFETRGAPVNLSIEQTFARHTRRDRTALAGQNAIGEPDPDLLVGSIGERREEQNVPTSRLAATFGGERFEGSGSVAWAPVRLSSRLPVTTTFGIDGGRAGQVSFIDGVVGSARRETLAGNVRLGMVLAPRWRLRLTTDYRDASTDSTLLGQRLVRIVNPDGLQTDLTTPLGAQSVFDFTEGNERVELERAGERWTLRAGALATQRTVDAVDRRSTGGTAGVAWRSGRFNASADVEHGTFQRFIFRTDPETVDRLRVRAAAPLGAAWSLRGEGQFERTENPRSVAALDHRAHSGTVDLSWAPPARDASLGLSVGATNLRTLTGLVLPGNAAGLSRYDLSLLTTTAHGGFAAGRYRVAGSLTNSRDNGATWPVQAWNANGRATMRGPAHSEFGVFGEHWSYDERRAGADDFNVTRYGVVLIWRLE